MDFVIEKNVSLPKYHKAKRSQWSYPLSNLEVGDSFLIPDKEYNKNNINVVGARIRTLKRHQNIMRRRFSLSRDPGSYNIRVWRTF